VIVHQIPQAVLDECYHGCGRGWAALDASGKVAEFRYADEYDVDEDPEDHAAFCRAELAKIGNVIEGMISACEFCEESHAAIQVLSDLDTLAESLADKRPKSTLTVKVKAIHA